MPCGGQLPSVGDEGDQDLRPRVEPLLVQVRDRLAESADLGVDEFGDDGEQPDAPEAQHGVGLMPPLYMPKTGVGSGVRSAESVRDGDRRGQLDQVGQELVQRRVEKSDRNRDAVHGS
jgi:hypothetical protein